MKTGDVGPRQRDAKALLMGSRRSRAARRGRRIGVPREWAGRPRIASQLVPPNACALARCAVRNEGRCFRSRRPSVPNLQCYRKSQSMLLTARMYVTAKRLRVSRAIFRCTKHTVMQGRMRNSGVVLSGFMSCGCCGSASDRDGIKSNGVGGIQAPVIDADGGDARRRRRTHNLHPRVPSSYWMDGRLNASGGRFWAS